MTDTPLSGVLVRAPRRRAWRRVTAGIATAALAASAALAATPAYAAGLAPEVTASIGVGSTPTALTISTDGSRVYTASYASQGVSIIDTAEQKLQTTIAGGSAMMGIVVTPDRSRAFTADWSGGAIKVFDLVENTLIGNVTGYTGYSPRGIAISPDGSRVYTANGGSVSVIDTATNAQIGTVPTLTGNLPWGVTVSPDGKRLYVVNYESEDLAVVDLASQQQIARIPVGDGPRRVAISPDNTRAYVTNGDTDTVSVIDTVALTKITDLTVGRLPYGVAVTPDGAHVLVANSGVSTVTVIDTADTDTRATVSVGSGPYELAVSPDSTTAYVGSQNSSSVSVISLAEQPELSPATQTLSATVGKAMPASAALTAENFDGAVTYTIAPAVPQGLSFSSSTGVLSGTPTTAQAATEYTITGTDGDATATATISLAVEPTLSLAATVLQATRGTAIDATAAPTASGFTGVITYSVVPALPSGLQLDVATGVISGTPTSALDGAVFTLTASDGTFTASEQFGIAVAGLAPSDQPLAAVHGQAIESTSPLTATGFSGDVVYTVAPALPAGLSFDASTGVISGTPTGDAIDKTTFTITATGTEAGVATATVKILIDAVAPAAPETVNVVPGAFQAFVSWPASEDDGGAGPVTYTVTAVPSGQTCTTTQTSCVITGLPAGTMTFSVVAATSVGAAEPAVSASASVLSHAAPETVPDATAGTSVRFVDASGSAVSSVTPGQKVTVEASGFLAGSNVQAFAYSTPTLLGSAVTDADGAASFEVTVPTDLTPGEHTLVAIGFGAGGTTAVATSALVVAAPGAPTAPGAPVAASLPATGVNPLPWAVLAAGLLAAGVLGLSASRMRRRA